MCFTFAPDFYNLIINKLVLITNYYEESIISYCYGYALRRRMGR